MRFSDSLLEAGEGIWQAREAHSFVRALAAGSLAEEPVLHGVRQDYPYLLDYARTFVLARVKTRDEGAAGEALTTDADGRERTVTH